MSMLRAKLDDVSLVCGYLHDASFQTSGIKMDSDAKQFSLKLERICYEKREAGKAFFFIPVIRYPWINSCLVVTGVERFETTSRNEHRKRTDGRHLLLDIERKGHDRLEISSDDLRLSLLVTPSSVFQGMEGIDKLRVDQDGGMT